MDLDERCVAMLAELGVRLWPRAPIAEVAEVAEAAGLAGAVAPLGIRVEATGGEPASAAPARATARDADTASMDWPTLRVAGTGCTACGLCEGRTKAVFGAGHERAHWMIIGEAPGDEEDARGEPFVGKAGQLLDNMLAALGLSRQAGPPERQVFIAHVLKCRPPKGRNPSREDLAQCAPFLERQVALVRPRMILAMGRLAAVLLAGDEPLGRLRGRVHSYLGVPTVVTYDPAYLLRNPTDKARAWDDLCMAHEALQATSGAD